MNIRTKITTLLLALVMLMSLCVSAAAAETAAAIQLTKTTGTVTVSKSNGKDVSMRTGMRLYNGYNITTAAESYAWISLDSTKLMKLDASSSVEVRKNGSKLEVNIRYGGVSFDVSQKLSSNESLNVSTSTMSVGIRGTCGWARVTDQWVSEICLLEGASQCVVADPVTSQLKSAQLVGGDTAQCVVYPQEKPGDKCDILMERQTTDGIPGFVLAELVQDVELCDRILEDSGLDVLRDLAETAGGDPSGRTPDGKSASPEVLGLTELRLSREQTEQTQKQEEVQKEADRQESNISKEPVWEQGQRPSTPSEPSVPWEPSTPTTPTAPGSPGTPPSTGPYTITFDYGDGTKTTQTTNAGHKLDNLPDEVTGVVGDGEFKWYTQAEGGTQVTTGTVFSSNQTVYARWDGSWMLDTRTGHLTIFSDAGMNSRAVNWGAHTANIKTVEIRSGVTTIANNAFQDCANLTSITIPDSVTNIGSHAFYRCSSLERITIPDGVTSIDGYTFYYCSSLTHIDIPDGVTSIDAFAFSYCSSLSRVDISGGIENISIDAFSSCAALTDIYYGNTRAKWNEYAYKAPDGVTVHCKGDNLFRYTVTFDANGGTVDLTTDTTGTDGKLTSLPTPTREGHTFDGWYTGSGILVDINDVYTADTTIYAHWTEIPPETYTVTFDSQGGSDAASATAAHGGKVSAPADPARDGCTFSGWYKEAACTTAWDFDNDTVTGDVTLYAKWIQLYTITFIANGGTIDQTTATTNVDGKLSGLPAPTREGCTFNGWYTATENGEQVTTDTVFSKNTSIYARWLGYAYANGVLTITDDAAMTGKLWCSANGYNISALTSVTISEGVTSIGEMAFLQCTNLTSVTIPDSVTNIGIYAFQKCSSLTSVTFGENSQLTSISGYAFSLCTNLTSVTIPDSVTSISNQAFWKCTGLTSVTFGENSQLTSIGENAFPDCTSLTSITIPEGVTSIGNQAFSGCTSLKSVTIPEGVTSIGDYAFKDCSSLTSVTIPDSMTAIPGGAFANCTGLTTVTIPEGVTSIGNQTFSGCTGLKSVTIPEGVTSIGEWTFYGCTRLTSITIPNSVTSIGGYAFSGCTGLKTINFGGTRAQWDSVTKGIAAIPDGVTVRCTDDSHTVTLNYNNVSAAPETPSVMTDDEGKAALPTPEHTNNTDGTLAFSGWFTQPSGGEQVTDDSVFTSDQTVYAQWTGWDWEYIAGTKTLRIFGKGTMQNYLLDIDFGGYNKKAPWISSPVSPPIEALAIEEGITNVGSFLLTDMNRASTPSYWGIPSLTEVSIASSVETLGAYAFLGCTGLTGITIPENVQTIGDYAFYGCTGLTSITIPDSVTQIGTFSFRGCTGLTSVTVPGSVATITSQAFGGCSSLTSATIQSGVANINSYAFHDCTRLTSVTIPNSVTSIGDYAFYGCTSLTDIYFGGTRAQWGSVTKGSSAIPDGVTVHCTDDVTVTFDLNGGSSAAPAPAVVHTDGTVTLPTTDPINSNTSPHKGLNFVFGGWYDSATGGEKITSSTKFSQNTTIYAHWTVENGWDWQIGSTLRIFGTGEINDYNADAQPWEAGAPEIVARVVIEDGVAAIGSYAFDNFSELRYVEIPSSVTSIGDHVFDSFRPTCSPSAIKAHKHSGTPLRKGAILTERR